MIGSDLNLHRQMRHHQDGLLAEARQQRLVNAARRARVDGVAASALRGVPGVPQRSRAGALREAPNDLQPSRTGALRFGSTVGRVRARLEALDRRLLVR